MLTKPPALCARVLDFKQRAVLAGMPWAPVAGVVRVRACGCAWT